MSSLDISNPALGSAHNQDKIRVQLQRRRKDGAIDWRTHPNLKDSDAMYSKILYCNAAANSFVNSVASCQERDTPDSALGILRFSTEEKSDIHRPQNALISYAESSAFRSDFMEGIWRQHRIILTTTYKFAAVEGGFPQFNYTVSVQSGECMKIQLVYINSVVIIGAEVEIIDRNRLPIGDWPCVMISALRSIEVDIEGSLETEWVDFNGAQVHEPDPTIETRDSE
ncbi:hypothetical protein R3P38DRAFT_2804494 [Favolaschia claudopus]|uniref:Uncharacterized protein n=1 Tax=Favolaschia claudopus TaxID=2862362 RepID=A0AAV9ZQN9_9AGAR